MSLLLHLLLVKNLATRAHHLLERRSKTIGCLPHGQSKCLRSSSKLTPQQRSKCAKSFTPLGRNLRLAQTSTRSSRCGSSGALGKTISLRCSERVCFVDGLQIKGIMSDQRCSDSLTYVSPVIFTNPLCFTIVFLVMQGELAIKGRELQYTKAWTLPFSANEMLFAKLRLKAGLDLINFRTFVRIGFRTEQVTNFKRRGCEG